MGGKDVSKITPATDFFLHGYHRGNSSGTQRGVSAFCAKGNCSDGIYRLSERTGFCDCQSAEPGLYLPSVVKANAGTASFHHLPVR